MHARLNSVLRFLLLLLVPLAAFAQPAPVVGYLGAESAPLAASRLTAFRKGLAETNYAEGRNVAIEYRWANGDSARLPALAAELVARKVSVLVAVGSAAAAAAKKASATIPLVFEVDVDPVEAGLVKRMSRPGGNATGVTSLNVGLGPKRLQILRELVPGLTSFALLVNPTNPMSGEQIIDDLQVAAHAQRLQFEVLRAASEPDVAVVFENLARQKTGGLVLANDAFFASRAKDIAQLALRHRIPAVHQASEFVAAGGLAAYAGSIKESHRVAGVYTGRILRGDKPGDLPVQQVRKMELSINAKTAKALGLVPPAALLSRADQVVK
jgi:putative ABC transport system substrate-binding protein